MVRDAGRPRAMMIIVTVSRIRALGLTVVLSAVSTAVTPHASHARGAHGRCREGSGHGRFEWVSRGTNRAHGA